MCWVSVHCLKFPWLNVFTWKSVNCVTLDDEEDDKGTSQTVMEKM